MVIYYGAIRKNLVVKHGDLIYYGTIRQKTQTKNTSKLTVVAPAIFASKPKVANFELLRDSWSSKKWSHTIDVCKGYSPINFTNTFTYMDYMGLFCFLVPRWFPVVQGSLDVTKSTLEITSPNHSESARSAACRKSGFITTTSLHGGTYFIPYIHVKI